MTKDAVQSHKKNIKTLWFSFTTRSVKVIAQLDLTMLGFCFANIQSNNCFMVYKLAFFSKCQVLTYLDCADFSANEFKHGVNGHREF